MSLSGIVLLIWLLSPIKVVAQQMYGLSVYREYPGKQAQVESRTFDNVSQLQNAISASTRKYSGADANYRIDIVRNGKKESPRYISNITWIEVRNGKLRNLKSKPVIPSESDAITLFQAYQCTNQGQKIAKTFINADLKYTYKERIDTFEYNIPKAKWKTREMAECDAEAYYKFHSIEKGDSILYEVIVVDGSMKDGNDVVKSYNNRDAYESFVASRNIQRQKDDQQQLLKSREDSINRTFPKRLEQISLRVCSITAKLDGYAGVADSADFKKVEHLWLFERSIRESITSLDQEQAVIEKIYDDINFGREFYRMNILSWNERKRYFDKFIINLKKSVQKRIPNIK